MFCFFDFHNFTYCSDPQCLVRDIYFKLHHLFLHPEEIPSDPVLHTDTAAASPFWTHDSTLCGPFPFPSVVTLLSHKQESSDILSFSVLVGNRFTFSKMHWLISVGKRILGDIIIAHRKSLSASTASTFRSVTKIKQTNEQKTKQKTTTKSVQQNALWSVLVQLLC